VEGIDLFGAKNSNKLPGPSVSKRELKKNLIAREGSYRYYRDPQNWLKERKERQ